MKKIDDEEHHLGLEAIKIDEKINENIHEDIGRNQTKSSFAG